MLQACWLTSQAFSREMGAQGSCCGDRETYDEEEYDVFYDAEDDADAAPLSAKMATNSKIRQRILTNYSSILT